MSIHSADWPSLKLEVESEAAFDCHADDIDDKKKDLAVIVPILTKALEQVSSELQYSWQITEGASTVLVKVQDADDNRKSGVNCPNDSQGVDAEAAQSYGTEDIKPDIGVGNGEDQDVTGTASATSNSPLANSSHGLSSRLRERASSSSGCRSESPLANHRLNDEPRMPEVRQYPLVTRVIQALEKDLHAGNFGGNLKELLERPQKFDSLIIAAVYLLPRGASFRNIQSFATQFVGGVSQWAGNERLFLARDKLVEEGILFCKDGPAPVSQSAAIDTEHYPGIRFMRSLPERKGVKMHHPRKLEIFSLHYDAKRMTPLNPKQKRKQKAVADQKSQPPEEIPVAPKMRNSRRQKSVASRSSQPPEEVPVLPKTESLPTPGGFPTLELEGGNEVQVIKQEVVVKVEAESHCEDPIDFE